MSTSSMHAVLQASNQVTSVMLMKVLTEYNSECLCSLAFASRGAAVFARFTAWKSSYVVGRQLADAHSRLTQVGRRRRAP